MTAPFVPGEYASYPYWHEGRIIAHQDPLPLESEDDDDPDKT